MIEFIVKTLTVTIAVNLTIMWTLMIHAGLFKPRNPWPERENLS